MATVLSTRRLARERVNLEKPNDDYVVLFKDENILKFDAYVFGPADTLYSHKFVKLRFEVPEEYPFVPPTVTFIQHNGGRIHPNLYTEGKVCLSILGTWEGEQWAEAMTCETILISIRSLLDNKPYTHEPGQADNPDYNKYVQYTTWRWLMLDYLTNETEPAFRDFLQTRIAKEGDAMLSNLTHQASQNLDLDIVISPYGQFWGRAASCAKTIVADWRKLEDDVKKCIEECKAVVEEKAAKMRRDEEEQKSLEERMDACELSSVEDFSSESE